MSATAFDSVHDTDSLQRYAAAAQKKLSTIDEIVLQFYGILVIRTLIYALSSWIGPNQAFTVALIFAFALPVVLETSVFGFLFAMPHIFQTNRPKGDPGASGAVSVWRAAAWGQKALWLKQNGGGAAEIRVARDRALAAIERVVALVPNTEERARAVMRQMFARGASGGDPQDDDLAVFRGDNDTEALVLGRAAAPSLQGEREGRLSRATSSGRRRRNSTP